MLYAIRAHSLAPYLPDTWVGPAGGPVDGEADARKFTTIADAYLAAGDLNAVQPWAFYGVPFYRLEPQLLTTALQYGGAEEAPGRANRLRPAPGRNPDEVLPRRATTRTTPEDQVARERAEVSRGRGNTKS